MLDKALNCPGNMELLNAQLLKAVLIELLKWQRSACVVDNVTIFALRQSAGATVGGDLYPYNQRIKPTLRFHQGDDDYVELRLEYFIPFMSEEMPVEMPLP